MDLGHGGDGRMPTATRPPARVVTVGMVLVALLTACSRVGEATIRIDDAEEELVRLVDEIVAETELEVTSSTPLGRRERCELVTTGQGASNRIALRGPIPEDVPVLERSAAILTEAGYQLVPGESEEELFGRRDGLRITVLLDRPTGEVAVDANTACRPLPR